ncbi:hypothetical protein AVEN_91593-1 [Araneus ventricosus]|uniref:Uncharacterized protein n=1 Tax=Araneus ventricosus TaxID=182803 RepID=A0A4Y1ZYM5_ARAVE|nr:hypothetical protein AVEN_91593-1 [Araneus ventricosus]
MTNSVEHVLRVEDLYASHVILLQHLFANPMRPLCIFLFYDENLFLQASSLVCQTYDSKMKLQKRKKAPLIAISHKNRTLSAQRDAIPSVFPGASETNKNSKWVLLLDFGQKRHPVPIKDQRSMALVPIALGFVRWLQHSGETSVNDPKVKGSGQRTQSSSYGQV